MSNPLLEQHVLPPFSRIMVDHIKPAITTRINEVKAVLEQSLATIGGGQPLSWESLVEPLEEASDLLSQAWSPVSHLNSVKNSDSLRQVYDECLQQLTELNTTIDQHEPLYQAYKKLADSNDFHQLSGPKKQVIQQTLRNFRLAGVALSSSQKQRYGEIQKALSALSTQFSNNVLDATQAWTCQFSHSDSLAGLPETALQAAQQIAQQKGLDGYVITLDMPSYLAVITYADDRALREKIYRALVTRASKEVNETNNSEESLWDNTPLIEETLSLRHELSLLLGFNNYAELSLATKMADSPEQVINFLTELSQQALPIAKKELQQLTKYAIEDGGIDTLEAWDVPYYSEKLRQAQYAISQEALRPYFPVTKVIPGLFSVVEKLFDIQIVCIDDTDVYHDDVILYAIKKNQHTIAYFYLDIYAREKKRGGAWMADCRTRRLKKSTIQLPVAYLTCNFTPPVGDTPSLLTHQEVTTLFHEFGHGLHHMLTSMTEAAVSGISGVAWDAVELPSQFLENWCWEESVIPMISGHYQTGDPLPKSMLEKMLHARNFQSAMQMVRQIEFALFDMTLHHSYKPEEVCNVQGVLDSVRQQVAVIIPPKFNKFQNSFSHIFAGGYAAGYYSYKWAEVLSADAFSLFEEKGIFDQETGRKFLNTILANGGSQEAMDLFIAFRGRKPSIDALLRHSGLLQDSTLVAHI